MFPNKQNVTPRYDQISLKDAQLKNQFHQILSPNSADEGVWAHQNAWFSMGNLSKDFTTTYTIKDKENGVYAFILEGSVNIEGQSLNKRDGFGVWNTDMITITASSDAKVLLMDVPMQG